ncbi:PDZ domain-containing protein 8 isoform X2 [Atheta coriaria]|uniref:PDZ domain-containing protein 8 isoform X2 n=1 Tax=Dalotia coriaria TaxID=877792 RepID=UPI0031F3BD5E
MDLLNLLLLIVISVCVGIVLTVVVQYYVLVRYFNKGPIAETPKKLNTEAYSLPEELKKKLECNENTSSSLPISLMLQFLFHELRHSDSIKQWLYKKLSMEFDELLTKTTIGKFFEAVTIRDMHLGSQFPDIKDISLDSIKLDKTEGHIDMLNLSIKLDYTGNFLLSVDAKMKFGKTAYLSIKVKRINGIGRLQFTRHPYTHWSFSFFNDPLIELAVESHFQGRQLQSNITNLIVNQIKKAIKRKHTLPNYKIRYKPFFVKTDPGQLDADDNEMVSHGTLEVSLGEISRLDAPPDVTNVHCTFTIDTIPFICLYQKENSLWLMLELTLTKVRQQQLGVIFKQETNSTVTIDSVTPQTPAFHSGLRQGDVILAIENKNISNVSQISKIIKAITSVNISFKVERCTSNYVMKTTTVQTGNKTEEKTPTICVNDAINDVSEGVDAAESFVMVDKNDKSDDSDGKKSAKSTRSEKMPKIITSGNENMSKFAQTLGNFALRKRKSSVTSEKSAANNGETSSNKSTPNPSCPSTPQHGFKHHSISLPTNFLQSKKHSISEVPEIIRTDTEAQECESLDLIEVQKTAELPLKPLMDFNDEYSFQLKENAKYLNINIWGTNTQREVLLGYANIPLCEILNACCSSLLGHYTRSYSFLPPNNTPPNAQSHPLMSHSGFEHVFCYGDILLSFVWNHDGDGSLKRKNSTVSEVEVKPTMQKTSINQHDFVRTQFHRSIHCDFCSKKIWLKDAVQCRDCGMCCHKKCISKCQLSTDCALVDRMSIKSDSSDQPDLIIGDVADDNYIDEEAGNSEGINIKRVNSVNNLSIPALDEIQNAQESHDAVNKLLDQMLICATDENLMESARESGRQLYATMVSDERIEKINAMMVELKKMFDIVTTEHADLIKKLNNEEVEVERAKLAFLLGQADAKIHGLSVLMLHYCSGLQQS